MTPRTGIATFTLEPIGQFRLDDEGLRLVNPFNPDPDFAPTLDRLVAKAFISVSGTHVTTREAVAKLPAEFGVPDSFLTDLKITGEEDIAIAPEGEVF